MNPNITWEIVYSNPDKPWNWYYLSSHPNISWEIVCSNPDKPWDWYELSKNPIITWEIVCSNPDKPWNWNWLSLNKFNRFNSCIIIQRWYRKHYKRRVQVQTILSRWWTEGKQLYYKPEGKHYQQVKHKVQTSYYTQQIMLQN